MTTRKAKIIDSLLILASVTAVAFGLRDVFKKEGEMATLLIEREDKGIITERRIRINDNIFEINGEKVKINKIEIKEEALILELERKK